MLIHCCHKRQRGWVMLAEDALAEPEHDPPLFQRIHTPIYAPPGEREAGYAC